MSPNLSFIFSWRIGLIDPNRVVMELDDLHATEKKVNISSITVLEAWSIYVFASCSAKCLIVISKYIRCC
jgi:hypothetical protein